MDAHRLKWFLHQHSLSIVLLGLFLSMLAYSRIALFIWPAIQSGEAPTWAWWAWETVVSNEADVFGAWMLVILTKMLTEKGSPESGDDEGD